MRFVAGRVAAAAAVEVELLGTPLLAALAAAVAAERDDSADDRAEWARDEWTLHHTL